MLISIVESNRQRFVISGKPRPRGHRHHIFKDVKPSSNSKKRKTTQVTKIVTVSGDGKETIKNFNHQDNQLINNWDSNQQNHQSNNHGQNHKVVKKFSNHGQAISDYDYPANHPAHNQNWKQKMNNHPPNPYPDSDNPYPDGSFPTNPHSPNLPSRPFPPNPPPDPQMFSVQLPPWNVPKYREYTTKCCTVINITSTDHSNEVEKGKQLNVLFWKSLVSASQNCMYFRCSGYLQF